MAKVIPRRSHCDIAAKIEISFDKKGENAHIYLSRFPKIRRSEPIEDSGSVEDSATSDLQITRWLGRIPARAGWWRWQQIQGGIVAYSDVRKL